MSKRTAILVAVALVVAGMVGWWLVERLNTSNVGTVVEENWDDPYHEPDTPAEAVDEVRLQEMATASCQCERTGTSEAECWSEYKAATSRYKIAGMATACAPVSTEMDCIATDEGEKCIVTGYGIPGICTDKEAIAVEAAYSTAFDRNTGGREDIDEATMRAAGDAANAAVNSTVARIRRGEAIAGIESTGGCAG